MKILLVAVVAAMSITSSMASLKETVSLREAGRIYNRMLPYQCFKRKNIFIASQCFERAEVWTYTMEEFFNVKAYKAFMYYTKKYRDSKTCKGHSKFHVTPVLMVEDENNGNVTPMAIDRLGGKPLNLHNWSRIFIKTNGAKSSSKNCHIPRSYHCPVLKWDSSYKGYEKTRETYSDYCYIVIVPSHMFYESDLETRRYQSDWDMVDVRRSFSKIKSSCDDRSMYSIYEQVRP